MSKIKYVLDGDKTPKVRVWLVHDAGYGLLKAEGSGGTKCTIAALNPWGQLQRFTGVSPDIGFDLDELGRIRLAGE